MRHTTSDGVDGSGMVVAVGSKPQRSYGCFAQPPAPQGRIDPSCRPAPR